MILSFKENIEMVKDGLNAEEKFFEKAVVTERFIKKYKNSIMLVVVLFVVVAIANVAYDINSQHKRDNANKALLALLQNANDQNALSNLKDASSNMYELWKYSAAIKENRADELEKLRDSKALILNDLAKYESAKTVSQLESYASNDGAIYKDLALVQASVLLLEEGKKDEAHKLLQKVSSESSLRQLVNALLHYGVK